MQKDSLIQPTEPFENFFHSILNNNKLVTLYFIKEKLQIPNE